MMKSLSSDIKDVRIMILNMKCSVNAMMDGDDPDMDVLSDIYDKLSDAYDSLCDASAILTKEE